MTLMVDNMRHKLPDRRQGVTETLWFRKGEEGEIRFQATFNWHEGGRVCEVFCLPFKEGAGLRNLMHHACMVTSVALQLGATMASLAHTIGEESREMVPTSMIGLIVRAGVTIDEQRGFPRDGAPAPVPEFLRGLA